MLCLGTVNIQVPVAGGPELLAYAKDATRPSETWEADAATD